jgi:hypothetical protein
MLYTFRVPARPPWRSLPVRDEGPCSSALDLSPMVGKSFVPEAQLERIAGALLIGCQSDDKESDM